MLRKLKSQALDFHGLPVRLFYCQHPLVPQLCIVDAATSFLDNTGKQHSFFGHSASNDLENAKYIACCEVLERMLATRSFYSEAEITSGLPGTCYFTGEPKGVFPVSSIFVREHTDMSSPGPKQGAGGLGLHTEAPLAIEHAIRELIEHHILSHIWYKEQMLRKLGDTELFRDGYQLNYFSISEHIPFVLAVITSSNNPVFFTGSSFSTTFSLAMEKARNEALQLLYNLLKPPAAESLGNNQESLERIATLTGEGALSRIKHLSAKLQDSVIVPAKNPMPLSQTIDYFFGVHPEVIVIPLKQWKAFKAFRVLIPMALTKNLARYQSLDTIHVPDPYC